MDKTKILLVIALISGLFASSIAYTFTRDKEQNSRQGVSQIMGPVVIAKNEILPGTILNGQQLDIRTIPVNEKMPGSFSRLSDVEGRYAKERIMPQEQLIDARLIPKGQSYGLPVTIPKGMRAVAIACNEVIGVAGFIKPGDKVDVLGTFDGQTMGTTATLTILEDIQVLAISQEMNKDEGKTAAVSSSATLAVTLDQAEKLTLAEEKGKLRLILRPPGDPAKNRNQSGADMTTPDQLVNAGRERTPAEAERLVAVREVPANKPDRASSVGNARRIPKSSHLTIPEQGSVIEVFRGAEREILRFPSK